LARRQAAAVAPFGRGGRPYPARALQPRESGPEARSRSPSAAREIQAAGGLLSGEALAR